jgi:hypothetical protein
MVNFLDPRLPARTWAKLQPCPMTSCWLWTGALLLTGYGSVARDGVRNRSHVIHRHVYETLVGPIPAGLHIDHKCRVKCCANPAHLEAVTQQENNRRAGAAKRASNTRCKRGHLFTGATTIVRKRLGVEVRWCRTCHNALVRQTRETRGLMGVNRLRKLGRKRIAEINSLLAAVSDKDLS